MLKQATLPRNTTYTHAGWTVTGLDMDIDEVHRVAYHKTSNLYVAVTSTDVDYVPSEEEQKQPGYNDGAYFRPLHESKEKSSDMSRRPPPSTNQTVRRPSNIAHDK